MDNERQARVPDAVIEFDRRLRLRGETCDFLVCPWMGSGRSGGNVFQLTRGVNLLLYVEASRAAQGEWSLAKHRLMDLRASGYPWALVLLQAAQTGYLLPSLEVCLRTESGDWALEEGGEHHVQEGSTLNPVYYFKSLDDMVQRILPHGLL